MESPVVLYQLNQRYSKIPSCSLRLDDFKKLFNSLCEINEEAAQLSVAELKKVPNQSDEDFEKLKAYATSLYKVEVQIIDSKGEYIVSDSESIFDESKLPDFINRIIIGNVTYHKIKTGREPLFMVVAQFDFINPPIFDFIDSPSLATTNNSFVQISGIKETWVSGAYDKLMSLLKTRGTKRAWLHGKNIYDLFLWFVFIPLIFWNLYKYEPYVSKILINKSPVLTVAIYLYFFIVALYLFRILFNYFRWVFPYMELVTSIKKGATAHRVRFFAIISAIALSLLYDIFRSIIKLIP